MIKLIPGIEINIQNIQMKVNNTIKTPKGEVTFQGELSEEEANVVWEAGLNWLFLQGILPFKMMQDKDKIQYVEGSLEKQ